MVEHAIEIELTPQLGGRQAVKLVTHRASAEKVGCAPFHLACARATERKTETSILDQPMHLIEQGRHLLDLVDHDLTVRFGRIGLIEANRPSKNPGGGYSASLRRCWASCSSANLSTGMEMKSPVASATRVSPA